MGENSERMYVPDFSVILPYCLKFKKNWEKILYLCTRFSSIRLSVKIPLTKNAFNYEKENSFMISISQLGSFVYTACKSCQQYFAFTVHAYLPKDLV